MKKETINDLIKKLKIACEQLNDYDKDKEIKSIYFLKEKTIGWQMYVELEKE